MKLLKNTIVLALVLFSFSTYSAQTKSEATTVVTDKVEIIYFHYTRRCATCNAVESETKKALTHLYPAQEKAGTYTFSSINLDEDAAVKKAKSLNVDGQTLLVVKGDKQVNLTNQAFLYAVSNPQKLEQAIQKAIESL